jgi:hypothetical protein
MAIPAPLATVNIPPAARGRVLIPEGRAHQDVKKERVLHKESDVAKYMRLSIERY